MNKIIFLMVFGGLIAFVSFPSSNPLTRIANSSLEKQDDSTAKNVLDENTQAEIIRLILDDIGKEDHAVTEDGRLYLSIADSLFEKLPKTINGIKIELLKGVPPDGKLKVAYLTFSGWSLTKDKVSVTNIAHFYGGNQGGCNFKFVKIDSKWTEQKRDCFASAS